MDAIALDSLGRDRGLRHSRSHAHHPCQQAASGDGYRACLGILRLAKTYSNERLEAASQRALQLQACSYSSLRSILKRSLDRQTTLDLESGKSGPQHENVRGADYYDPPTTLLQ